jgi:hypothetical protein
VAEVSAGRALYLGPGFGFHLGCLYAAEEIDTTRSRADQPRPGHSSGHQVSAPPAWAPGMPHDQNRVGKMKGHVRERTHTDSGVCVCAKEH